MFMSIIFRDEGPRLQVKQIDLGKGNALIAWRKRRSSVAHLPMGAHHPDSTRGGFCAFRLERRRDLGYRLLEALHRGALRVPSVKCFGQDVELLPHVFRL